MSDLLNYIKEENQKTREWVNEDPENRFAGYLTEDLDHWYEHGIYTVYEFKCNNLIEYISDAYKEINGFRPRHMRLHNMSLELLEEVANDLSNQIKKENEYEEEVIVNLCKEFSCTEDDLKRWEVI